MSQDQETQERTPPLDHPVGYRNVVPKLTGELSRKVTLRNPTALDQYAEVLRMFARELLGVEDQESLDGIKVTRHKTGNFLNGNIIVHLDTLPDEQAAMLRDLVISHSKDQEKSDPNERRVKNIGELARRSGKNIEFMGKYCNSQDQDQVVADTISHIAEVHGLGDKVRGAVLAVEAAVADVVRKDLAARAEVKLSRGDRGLA